MVKKIRVVGEELDDSMSSDEFQRTLLELGKSIDWKLWEMLQTMQRLDKKLTVDSEDE